MAKFILYDKVFSFSRLGPRFRDFQGHPKLLNNHTGRITRSRRKTRFRRLVRPYRAGSTCKVLVKGFNMLTLHGFSPFLWAACRTLVVKEQTYFIASSVKSKGSINSSHFRPQNRCFQHRTKNLDKATYCSSITRLNSLIAFSLFSLQYGHNTLCENFLNIIVPLGLPRPSNPRMFFLPIVENP